jgi:Mn2+/Fe2+ NRAMP family transporter
MAALPAPPPFTWRNLIGVVGPGTIALGVAIGAGEWLLGPAVTAQYGAALLWVATVSVLLQTVYNEEACRYTLYTGEPIYAGFMRTRPGPTFWACVYSVLAFLQIGWPGVALSAATALAAGTLGRLPTDADRDVVLLFGYATLLGSVAIIVFGAKVERSLEKAQWFMIAWIIGFLLIVGIAFVSPSVWLTIIGGFVGVGAVQQGLIPPGTDLFLLAGFAAYAGLGGIVNATISNWARDKGLGMGAAVGYIPAAVGGRKLELAAVGKVFETTPANLTKWRAWWQYLHADQVGIWAVGCFVGLALPALITVQFVPPGTAIGGFGVAVQQAEGIARVWGPVFWFLTLLTGFWILFSSQLGLTDVFPRMVTDMLWTGSARVRAWRGGDIRIVYYGALAIFVGWGCIAINLTQPLVLVQIAAIVGSFNFVVLAIHTLIVNRRFLPPELQAPAWRQWSLAAMALFFGVFTVAGILNRFLGIRF